MNFIEINIFFKMLKNFNIILNILKRQSKTLIKSCFGKFFISFGIKKDLFRERKYILDQGKL